MDERNLIREEIRSELEELKKMELGSDEYKATIDGIAKLTDRLIEIDRLDVDCLDKEERRNMDYEAKRVQIRNERIDRIIKIVLDVVKFTGISALAVWTTLISMKFEKTDSFTSLLGRKWITVPLSYLEKVSRN